MVKGLARCPGLVIMWADTSCWVCFLVGLCGRLHALMLLKQSVQLGSVMNAQVPRDVEARPDRGFFPVPASLCNKHVGTCCHWPSPDLSSSWCIFLVLPAQHVSLCLHFPVGLLSIDVRQNHTAQLVVREGWTKGPRSPAHITSSSPLGGLHWLSTKALNLSVCPQAQSLPLKIY